MVISVSHLTDQVEIADGHAPILSGAPGPAPPPSAGPRAPNPNTNPTLSLASDSYTSIPRGGYDEPFLFHAGCILDTKRRPGVHFAEEMKLRSRLFSKIFQETGERRLMR